MTLSNTEIAAALAAGLFSIDPAPVGDPDQPPYNTSAIDLHLSPQLRIPKTNQPVAIDLKDGGIAPFLAANSDSYTLSDAQPFRLKRNQFVLANMTERVAFPLQTDATSYAARVEGRSSLARCGILVHFTAPTIHAGFAGTITLEIINLGFTAFLLRPGLPICQLIIEEVRGAPALAPNQFLGQANPEGTKE